MNGAQMDAEDVTRIAGRHDLEKRVSGQARPVPLVVKHGLPAHERE
jgi:hypothetical protein